MCKVAQLLCIVTRIEAYRIGASHSAFGGPKVLYDERLGGEIRPRYASTE